MVVKNSTLTESWLGIFFCFLKNTSEIFGKYVAMEILSARAVVIEVRTAKEYSANCFYSTRNKLIAIHIVS